MIHRQFSASWLANGWRVRRPGPVTGAADADPGSDTRSPDSQPSGLRTGRRGPTPPGSPPAAPAPPGRCPVMAFANSAGCEGLSPNPDLLRWSCRLPRRCRPMADEHRDVTTTVAEDREVTGGRLVAADGRALPLRGVTLRGDARGGLA